MYKYAFSKRKINNKKFLLPVSFSIFHGVKRENFLDYIA